MSDVAAVAAITGGASVLTSGITAMVTWTVSRNSSAIELAKVTAENERLRQNNREDERRNRQSTYHQFIDVLNLLFQALGSEIDESTQQELTGQYNHLLSGVLLFGPLSVRAGAQAVNEAYGPIWPALTQAEEDSPDKPYPERWRDATSGLKQEFGAAGAALVDLMHADVTRGIADDQDG